MIGGGGDEGEDGGEKFGRKEHWQGDGVGRRGVYKEPFSTTRALDLEGIGPVGGGRREVLDADEAVRAARRDVGLEYTSRKSPET